MLANKIIAITGGMGRLGSAFVVAAKEAGGIPIILDVNSRGNIKKPDNVLDVDITNKKQLEEAIACIHEKYGKIDAIINNAYPRNKNYGRHFFDVDYEDFIENLGMHLGGYFNSSQQFARYFKVQGYGNIVNISSVYGLIAPKFEIYDNTLMTMPIEYAAIKGGLNHLTRYMAKYFKGLNIRVNTLSLGGILDNQPNIFIDAYNENCLTKGMLNECDVIGALLFLLSDESKFVNGQNIVVDDGFTL